MNEASVGRILHYTYPADEPGTSSHAQDNPRPAIVVQVWPDEYAGDPREGFSVGGYNVQVFTDGGNDFPDHAAGTRWVTSARIADKPTPGCLHWPARV